MSNTFLIVSVKISSLELASWENLNDFFQYFQFKSHIGDYEGAKAFTECCGSDELQKWSQNILRQNGKCPYIIQQSNLLTESFIFRNSGKSKTGIIFLKVLFASIFASLINAQITTLVKLIKLRQNQSVINFFHEDISQYYISEKGMFSETQTLEKADIVSVLIYLYFLEVDLGSLPHIMELFVASSG